MNRIIYWTVLLIVILEPVNAQDKKETTAYFDLIKEIVNSENSGNRLLYRLGTLKLKFMPSRSNVSDYLNRDIDLGFKHRRISINLNFAGFQIDLLCYKDTIFLKLISTNNYTTIKYSNHNKSVIDAFLIKRNKVYNSEKTFPQLTREISLREEYAFYCGDGNPQTPKGKFIGQLVEEQDICPLLDMLKSFNCEIQAYGIAGFTMLVGKNYEIPAEIQRLVDHIKNRNAELIICSGCMSGLIDKIYDKK